MLKRKSLRFWIALGMLVALAPLTTSAGLGYLILSRGVIAPVHDVAFRQKDQIIPIQRLQLLIWNTMTPVDEYIADGNPLHREAFRSFRAQIETGFAELLDAVNTDATTQAVMRRARESWTTADTLATRLISAPNELANPRRIEAMERFHGEIVATSDKLQAAYAKLAGEIQQDHDIAVLTYERSIWIAGIAGAVSLLAIFCGVFVIGRIIGGSVDRLVEGAALFAKGEREHRIDVQVPPELRRVADEFNLMIGRIRESEDALAALAHLDSLTGLYNRRAFEHALSEAWARFERYGEPCCLLAIDIDHFKRVNDTYGHAAGDDVLQAISKVMIQTKRRFDQAFRIGGEEFTIILRRTDRATARAIAERLRRAVEFAQIGVNGNTIEVTVSIGVSEASDDLDAKRVVEHADAALYQAKSNGRNCVAISSNSDASDQNAA
ncbi:GGDEF domain-containing protein [Rhodobium orientis]|nr:diguanylate cyclase [Rhodobium orientis]